MSTLGMLGGFSALLRNCHNGFLRAWRCRWRPPGSRAGWRDERRRPRWRNGTWRGRVARRKPGPATRGLDAAADPDNPVALMLASRSELKLADSQVVSLRTISHALSAQSLPLRERLDSLRPPGDTARAVDFVDLSGKERDSILQTRRAVAQLVGALHDNAVHGRAAALQLLTPAQRAQYSDIEQRVANASPQDTAAQQRGGGGRGGGRGRPSGMPANGTPAGVSSP